MADSILHKLCNSIPRNMPRGYYTPGFITSSALSAVLTAVGGQISPLRLWGVCATVYLHICPLWSPIYPDLPPWHPCLQSDTSGPLKAATGLGLDPAKGFNQPALSPQQKQVCTLLAPCVAQLHVGRLLPFCIAGVPCSMLGKHERCVHIMAAVVAAQL